jgi:hypothetical protein
VLGSLLVLLAIVYIPGLNSAVFGNVPLGVSDWFVVLPLILVPAAAAEVQKATMRRRSRHLTAASGLR